MSDPPAKPAESGPGATYYTPMHPGGVLDTSRDLKIGPARFNWCVSLSSVVLIWTFCIWCMIAQPCSPTDFAGTCSLAIDGDLDKEQCSGLAGSGGVVWVPATVAHCWTPGTAVGTANNLTSQDTCTGACADCESFYPPETTLADANVPGWACACPCPQWVDAEDGPGGAKAYCKALGSSGDTTNADLTALLADFDEAKCNELAANLPRWTNSEDDSTWTIGAAKNARWYRDPAATVGGLVTAAHVAGKETSSSDCNGVGGVYTAAFTREAAPLTGQPAIDEAATCKEYTYGCPVMSNSYDTASFDSDHADFDMDWSANQEFSRWKTWVAAKFNWFYIGSQDVWIVFIIFVYFSKYSTMKLCKKGDEDVPPEYSDASWFSMLFCSGIGVGLFYFGVAEPVWHYADSSVNWGNRFNRNPNLTDEQVAQEAMNLTFFHWGLHGFVVYTQVGLILGIVAYRWGLPMTMKSCFYPLLGDKVFGILGDAIDTLSVITTLFGVCTSLGLGCRQLAAGLARLTYDERTGLSSIENTTTTQVVIVWVITLIATCSVVSGIKNGIQRLSNVAFTMGLAILFVGFYIGDTWYLLNVFVQSTGYYFQWIIQLGSTTSAFATSPFELWDAHGVDLSPTASPAGHGHSMNTEAQTWMDGWTLFYWGWWIAWSPFVGTFMAKISKGRTIKQFILGSCFGPMLFGFIWFSVFGGVGIQMVRDTAAAGITGTWSGAAEHHQQVLAVLETTTLPSSGQISGGLTHTAGWINGYPTATTTPSLSDKAYARFGCKIQATVQDCAKNPDCNYQYLRDPSLQIGIGSRQKEDMWYDVMLSYGAPDGFMGWLLFVFSMLSLVLYFVTSSDSGSLVIDILSANGCEEPPVVQRIFWAVMEGLTASALLVAGGSNSLNALSTVSIVAGLPYTVLLCFTCVSTWRALQMDAGDIVYSKDTEFTISLAEVVVAKCGTYLVPFLTNLLCPILVIAKHGNILYTIMAALFFYTDWIFAIMGMLGFSGWSAMAAMSYLMFVGIVWDIRGKARAKKNIPGNVVEDFFAIFLFYPGVMIQLDKEFSSVNAVAAVGPTP